VQSVIGKFWAISRCAIGLVIATSATPGALWHSVWSWSGDQ